MKRSLKLAVILLICISFIISVPIVHAEESVKGDMDGDGVATTLDARLMLRFSAKVETPTQEQLATGDVDSDGIITLEDVKEVLSFAVDLEKYEMSLVKKGFPVSYAEYLTELHKKYPDWEFVPMITGLDWEKTIDNERSPHKQQLIENTVQASFMCSCKSCKGVIQESSSWVSASEAAVKYYMDPRNFLDEEHIFQFESTAYDKSQTKNGVEAILKNTWMYDSNITYVNASGTKKTYKEDGKTVKYSEAILDAAKTHGISAYYLASKIVQEVGSSTASYAGGSCGTMSPYLGIYNYYNIGAYTGAKDGLKWANGYMKASKKATLYKKASSSSTKVVTVSSGKELYYIGKSGSYYKVKATVKGKTYTGYIKKSSVSMYTTYGRPWTTPQKTIFYGAQYIYDSYSQYQYTGYLQKFNVNPQSEDLHNHEYMANVRAAAAEAAKTYKAYVSAGILDDKKVFSIPVFENMPGANETREERFKSFKTEISCSAYTTSDVTHSWVAIEDAEKYQIYKYNSSTKKYKRVKTTSSLSYKDTTLTAGKTAKYKVRAYRTNSEGKKIYSAYSPVYEAALKPAKVTGLKVDKKTSSSVKLKWTAVTGAKYAIYRSKSGSSYSKIGTSTTASYTDKKVSSGTGYKYKIKAYYSTANATFYSAYSSVVSVTTSGKSATSTSTAKSGYVNITDGYLNVRKTASTSGEIVAELSNGHSLRLIGTSGDWYQVDFVLDGKSYTGYAHSNYISVGAADTEDEKCPYTEPTSTVSQGDSGEAVKWVQWYLYKLEFLEKDDVDGDFGEGTAKAVKAFQAEEDLTTDGVVGSGTRSELKSAYGA